MISGNPWPQCPTATPTILTARLQFQAPRRPAPAPARRQRGSGSDISQSPTPTPTGSTGSSRSRQTRWPARPVGQGPRWPAPAAWSSRRPSARRPRCHTTTATSSTGRLQFQAPRWPAPAAWSSRRPAARRPRCRTPTGTAPAPARRLIPVTWWPGEHRPRYQVIAGIHRPRCRTTTATSPTGRLQRQAPGGQPGPSARQARYRHPENDPPRHPPARPVDTCSRRPVASPARPAVGVQNLEPYT